MKRWLMLGLLTGLASLMGFGVMRGQQAYAFPDLLTFHEAPTTIEQTFFLMFLEHRMRTFRGAFHANPDYSFWYRWSKMQQDLASIKEKAADLRATAATAKPQPGPQEKPNG